MIRTLMTLATFTLLNACSYWPPEGQGGQAESFETARSYGSSTRAQNIQLLECLDRTLQKYASSPIRHQYPARLIEFSIDWTRAVRAHAALMDIEAQYDLSQLAEKIHHFQKTLNSQAQFQLVSTSRQTEENCK